MYLIRLHCDPEIKEWNKKNKKRKKRNEKNKTGSRKKMMEKEWLKRIIQDWMIGWLDASK